MAATSSAVVHGQISIPCSTALMATFSSTSTWSIAVARFQVSQTLPGHDRQPLVPWSRACGEAADADALTHVVALLCSRYDHTACSIM